MLAGNTIASDQKPICTICFEDLKPIVEDLQSIPICGHVFHELCIQQWMEYCPAGKKPTCPVCKQSCLRDGLTRLYFQSTGDQTQVEKSVEKGREIDAEELEKEVRRLEGKVFAVTANFEKQQDYIKKLIDELAAWKELTRKEEIKIEAMRKEKERTEFSLRVKTEELARTSTECAKLQERSLGLAKELAALKLTTDLNLGEEEMVKLASIGHERNPQNAIDVLKKSLALRNKSYKELMTQCNLMGRSDTHARKKVEKYKEKIQKLRMRIQELEKALEEKENEILRNLKNAKKDKAPKQVGGIAKPNEMRYASNHVEYLRGNLNSPEVQNASASVPTTYKENDIFINLENDSYFMDDEVFRPSPELNVDQNINPSTSLPDTSWRSGIGMKSDEKGNSERLVDKKVTHVATSTWTTETLVIDDISKILPSIVLKKEADTYEAAAACPGGLFGSESANRTIGKWCKSSSMKTTPSSGNLISVGSDGRGGRVKVLRDHDQKLDGNGKTLWPKKHKNGGKQSGQFNIEHFFVKTEN